MVLKITSPPMKVHAILRRAPFYSPHANTSMAPEVLVASGGYLGKVERRRAASFAGCSQSLSTCHANELGCSR